MKLNLVLLNFLKETEGVVGVASTNEYFYQIYLPVIIWLVLVLILIVVLLKKYTLNSKWTKDNPNPYSGESLSLPRGTFRSILTLTLLFVVVLLELVSVHTIGFEDNVREFLTAFQMMIAFYFGSKVLHHMTNSDKEKAGVVSEKEKERVKRIGGYSEENKHEKEYIPTPEVVEGIKDDVVSEEIFDDGSEEGIEEDEDFDEEIEFGGDDPDAKG